METKDSCRTGKGRGTTVRRTLRDHELRLTLEEYEGFICRKAWQYARRYDDQKDFQQVGRKAVVEVLSALEDGLVVRSEKGYYLNSIDNAMLDYYRKEYRRNCEVWQYDRKNGPTRVKRYRYGGEWKARIQYHGDKLKRIAHRHRTPLNYEEVFAYEG